jgi:hypothetical protein
LRRPNPPPYALDNIAYYAAILFHYVSDGHVPLHSVVNYDGQLTNQHGLHGRWESELVERNRAAITIAPAVAHPVTNPRDFMFEVLLASNRVSGSARGRGRLPWAASSTTPVFRRIQGRFGRAATERFITASRQVIGPGAGRASGGAHRLARTRAVRRP